MIERFTYTADISQTLKHISTLPTFSKYTLIVLYFLIYTYIYNTYHIVGYIL